MEIYITDETLTDIVLIDNANMIWNTKYNDAGEFEIYAPASKELLEVARKGVFAYREDSDNVMILEKIQTKTDQEAGNYVIISGSGAEKLLNRRIIWSQTNINSDVAAAARQVTYDNLIEPADKTRKMPIVKLGDYAPAQMTTQRQLWGESLFDIVKEILGLKEMGFRIRKSGYNLMFDIYKGVDRSGDITFSPEYDNLLRSEYTYDKSDYKNVALVSGEGEGELKKTCSVGTAAGLERREVYVEKGSVSSNEGTITEENYMATLKGEGDTALAEKKISETVNAEIEPGGLFQFGIDYNLGDIVNIKDDFGNTKKVRIVQISENSDENEENLVLSCENIK